MTTYHETSSIVPHGENIRRAVRLVEEMSLEWNQRTVSDVALRYDLTPIEEQFLIDQFVHHKGIGG